MICVNETGEEMTDHKITLGVDEELNLRITLPDGQVIAVYYDYPDDYPESAAPELAIHLPQELTINAWREDKKPTVLPSGEVKPSSIVVDNRNEIVIPIPEERGL